MQTSLLQSGRCPTTAARGALPRPSGWRVGTECRSACDPKPRRTCDLVSRGGGVGAVGCHLRRRCLHSCPWVCVRPEPGAAEDAPPRTQPGATHNSSGSRARGLFVGGVKLPLALTELGLIDEYEFVVHPRLAGHGPTLFAGLSKHVDLKLVNRREFGSGRWPCGMSLGGSHRTWLPESAASWSN